jgi:hypothetical protein
LGSPLKKRTSSALSGASSNKILGESIDEELAGQSLKLLINKVIEFFTSNMLYLSEQVPQRSDQQNHAGDYDHGVT